MICLKTFVHYSLIVRHFSFVKGVLKTEKLEINDT